MPRGVRAPQPSASPLLREADGEVGFACKMYQSEHLRNLPCKRVHCDDLLKRPPACYFGLATKEQHEEIEGEKSHFPTAATCAEQCALCGGLH